VISVGYEVGDALGDGLGGGGAGAGAGGGGGGGGFGIGIWTNGVLQAFDIASIKSFGGPAGVASWVKMRV